MNKKMIIHCHFYQPAEFDPFSGEMLHYDASGFKNFTQKAAYECYIPNTKNKNLSKINFDFGAILLKYIEENHKEAYDEIINSDAENLKKYNAGNAIALPYTHPILPLFKKPSDIELQIRWGLLDFEARYKRKPKGLWLPECAVDRRTLELIAKNGLKFTILGRNQVYENKESGIYRTETREGSLILFLFDDYISNQISFYEDSTRNADDFMRSICGNEKKILILATDGEVYGHHHKFQEIFLYHLLNNSLKNSGYETAFFEMFLDKINEYDVVNIIENTSWSCNHNLERWNKGCNCTPNDSSWKGGLRNGIETLDEEINALLFSEHISEDSEILERFVLTKTIPEYFGAFSDKFLKHKDEKEKNRILKILDAKYYSQLAMTSCGWFFEDLDSLRPVNNIRFAAKAVLLIREGCGNNTAENIEKEIGSHLQSAKSWRTQRNAFEIYEEIKREQQKER